MVAFYLCGDVLNVKHVLLGPVREVKIVNNYHVLNVKIRIHRSHEQHISVYTYMYQVGVETKGFGIYTGPHG